MEDNTNDNVNIKNPLSKFKPLTQDEIKNIINKMAPKHSQIDPLPTWLVKNCLNEFLPIISEIVNTSLITGIMPHTLKHALIKPLLKGTNLDLVKKNYRPVSNLKFLSKVVETAVIQQFTQHLNVNNLNDPRQSAYKPLHSTETLLSKIHNDIMIKGNQDEVTILVLLDLSAAFDTIDHDILLHRLENGYGIKRTALNWFKSYLSNRTQSVIINDTCSNKKKLRYGVPQGSKLGPLLFNAYIAPLSEIAKRNDIEDENHADDEQLILSFKPNPAECLRAKCKIEICINEIRDFLLKNKLCNNGEKTEFIIVGRKSQLAKVNLQNLQINNCTIRISDKIKNLGVIFDRHMTMDNHIAKMCRSAYFNIRNISKVKKLVNTDCLKMLVNSLVTPHLDYGNGLLLGVKLNSINKLQLAQNSAVRLIANLRKHDHITESRRRLHWLPIKARIEYKVLANTWKAVNNQAPEYLKSLIKNKESSRHLRSSNSGLLSIPKVNTGNSWGDRAFSIAGPTLWNKLPQSLRQINNYNSFKRQLKTHLFNKYYNNTHA